MQCADLDSGVDGVADDAGAGLPGAEPHRGDLGASVEHEMRRHPSRELGPINEGWKSGATRETSVGGRTDATA